MKITKITIQNYRSIQSEVIDTSDFNIFVGQNNHGKTNIFEAIDWFFNKLRKGETLEQISYEKNTDEEVFVELEFSGAKEAVDKMKSESGQTKIRKLLNGADTITIRRSSKEMKTRVAIVNGKEEKPLGIDNAWDDLLPKFEYVDTKKYYEELMKFGRTATPISTMLSGVLETLLETTDEYKDFRQKFEDLFRSDKSQVKIQLDKLSGEVRVYLEKQFPDCVKVEFTIGEPTFIELLKNFNITIHDGIETNADEKGDGMQRALMLAIIQAYADYRKTHEEVGKSFLFFIDEAELHLHPTAQRNLKKALLDLSENGDQVFINTHSSVFVADDHLQQTIFRVEKSLNKTSAQPISDQEKPSTVYELLGGSPADLLLPKNFMIVEGQSEKEFLQRVIERFYANKPVIQIIFSRGDLERQKRTMYHVNEIFVPIAVTTPIYKDRLVLLCDKPSSQQKENAREEFLKTYPYLASNNQHFELPVDALEKYFPDPWKKNDAEIDALEKQHGKVIHARDVVAENITQEQFEREMPVVFEALTRCWDLAY